MRWLSSVAASLLCAVVSAGPAHFIHAPVQDLKELRAKLSDPQERDRRNAVRDLAEIATADAFELIVEEALGDLAPRVADEAQLQLGQATASEGLFAALDSKAGLRSRAALVRERVFEALGRIDGAVPIGLFQRGLKDKEADVRTATAWALARRGRSGVAAFDLGKKRETTSTVKALTKVAKTDRDEAARAAGIAALGALASLDSSAAEALEAAADRGAKSALVRAATLRALRETNTYDDLAAGLDDGAHGVAMTALGLLEERGDREAMIRIARALGSGGDDGGPGEGRRARVDAYVRTLRRASGLSTGAVRERWVRWAEGLASDWSRESERSKKGAEGTDDKSASTTFYGLKVASDRLVFLVDMSGSMWKDRGETSRKEQVEIELAKTLRQLPEDTYFNLVPYANNPGPWETKLVPATSKNVERAITWFERNTQRGRGDVWSALVPVLRDPSVDTVVILFDGAPSGGSRWNVELMRSLLGDENRLRGVVIHTVLFEASGFLKRSWEAIAEDARGTQVLIE